MTAGPGSGQDGTMPPHLPLFLFALACSDGTGRDLDCEAPVDRYPDGDGDGYGAYGADAQTVCPDDEGFADVPIDCDDADPLVHPEAEETCNGRDDNCSGEIDEGFDRTLFFTDADGDGYGVRYPAQLACSSPGAGWVENTADCDDGDPDRNPEAAEVCNGGVDDDCNGRADDLDPNLSIPSTGRWYRDEDADGYGDPATEVRSCIGPAGVLDLGGDCDDRDPDRNPETEEIPANGIDENCNEMEGCYDDADFDGARAETWREVPDLACAQPGNAPESWPLDCDDNDPIVNVLVDWYEDPDGDGYGSGEPQATSCLNPGGGLVPASEFLDCNEQDPDHNPGTTEICDNGIDENCDLRVDCDDPSCVGTPGCLLPCADIDLGSTVPLQTSGNTTNQVNDTTPSCIGFGTAPDVALQWTPPADGTYTIDTFGSSYDTSLYVYDQCGGAQIACNDDSGGLQSQVQVTVTGGIPLIVVVDGYSAGSGAFVLNIN